MKSETPNNELKHEMDTCCELCGCGLICLGEVLMCPECGNLTEADES